jgi:GT2 family glycosyltransferase
MAFEVETLRDIGGFNEEYDVGNAYREETETSYRSSKKGRIIYRPGASLNHLEVEEEDEVRMWMFYSPYLTKYFLSRNNVVKGVSARLKYFRNMVFGHTYFLTKSLGLRNMNYIYYLYGELASFWDFILLNKKPREYI